MTIEMQFSELRPGMTSHHSYEAWLIVDGVTVSYLHLMTTDYYNGYACVCDIETREGHERKGYATEIMRRASEKLGMPLATTGSFTPEGFAALYGKLPLLTGYEDMGRPVYKSMKFVADWDKKYGPN